MDDPDFFPVTFELNGKEIKAFLFKPRPSGSEWHLNVGTPLKSMHWGRIYYRKNSGDWDFAWNVKGMEVHQDFLVDTIIAWYQ